MWGEESCGASGIGGGRRGGLSRELCVLGISKAWELLRVSALRKVGGGAACEP